jgi:hypothetical protein
LEGSFADCKRRAAEPCVDSTRRTEITASEAAIAGAKQNIHRISERPPRGGLSVFNDATRRAPRIAANFAKLPEL